MPRPSYTLKEHPDSGQAPYEYDQDPPPSTVEYSQGERRVRAGNDEIDRAVLDDLKYALGLAARERVIERRGQVQQHHRRGEDTRANDERRTTAIYRRRDEEGGGGDRSDETQTMADAIRDFFPDGLNSFGYERLSAHDITPTPQVISQAGHLAPLAWHD